MVSKKQPKIKIYTQPKKSQTKKGRVKRPIIRGKNDKLIQRKVANSISVSKMQRELEKAIKQKDFSEYDRIMSQKDGQSTRMEIDLILNALNVLKQKIDNAILTGELYDPTNESVKNIISQGQELKKRLEKEFQELIRMRPNAERLNDRDKNRVRQIKDEVDRISLQFDKIDNLVDKIKDMPKLSPDEREEAKKKAKVKEDRKKIREAVGDIKIFGFDKTKKEQDLLQEVLKTTEGKKALKEEIIEKRADVISRIFEKLDRMKSLARRLEEIADKLNEYGIKGTIESKKGGSDELKSFNSIYLKLMKNYDKYVKYMNDPELNNMEDVKKFFEISVESANSLGNALNNMVNMGNGILAKYGPSKAKKEAKKEITSSMQNELDKFKDDYFEKSGLNAVIGEIKNHIANMKKFRLEIEGIKDDLGEKRFLIYGPNDKVKKLREDLEKLTKGTEINKYKMADDVIREEYGTKKGLSTKSFLNYMTGNLQKLIDLTFFNILGDNGVDHLLEIIDGYFEGDAEKGESDADKLKEAEEYVKKEVEGILKRYDKLNASIISLVNYYLQVIQVYKNNMAELTS